MATKRALRSVGETRRRAEGRYGSKMLPLCIIDSSSIPEASFASEAEVMNFFSLSPLTLNPFPPPGLIQLVFEQGTRQRTVINRHPTGGAQSHSFGEFFISREDIPRPAFKPLLERIA